MNEIKESLAQLSDRITNMENGKMNKIKEKAIQAEAHMEKKISEHPMHSVGIAFGSGLLIGAVASSMIKSCRT